MSQVNVNSNSQQWYKSPMLIGWLFLVLTAMAGTIYMVIQANTGFPGLVVDDFYERGQNYEENILTKLENNEKWTTEFQVPEILQNKSISILFSINDNNGQPVSAEKIILFAYRPSNAKKDFSAPMSLSDDQRTYQANMTFDSKGKWDLLASVTIDGTEVNYAKNVFVKDAVIKDASVKD
ncbi:MAG: FixH family protein [Gammaproteobacteria bacterium]|nr:FixH family protein [Gammaproteobacteria bacterium]